MGTFNFNELTIYIKKCLYISDNKAVVRNKKLYNIAEMINNDKYKNFYVEECLKDSQNYNDYAKVFIDLGIVCLYCNNTMDIYTTIDTITHRLKNLTTITLDYILSEIRKYPDNKQFVNVADIKLLELSGASQEELNRFIEYRATWYERKEKEDKEKEEQREKENIEYINNKNNEVAELVKKAELAITNKEKVQNEDITIYKSRYESNTTSLILHMMKSYNINIPLKTQGWINQALANIFYRDEEYGYSYQYYKSSKNSEVFYKYLRQLIQKINEKYNVVKEEEKETETNLEIKRLFGLIK